MQGFDLIEVGLKGHISLPVEHLPGLPLGPCPAQLRVLTRAPGSHSPLSTSPPLIPDWICLENKHDF